MSHDQVHLRPAGHIKINKDFLMRLLKCDDTYIPMTLSLTSESVSEGRGE